MEREGLTNKNRPQMRSSGLRANTGLNQTPVQAPPRARGLFFGRKRLADVMAQRDRSDQLLETLRSRMDYLNYVIDTLDKEREERGHRENWDKEISVHEDQRRDIVMGIKTINEVRRERGLPPFDDPRFDRPNIPVQDNPDQMEEDSLESYFTDSDDWRKDTVFKQDARSPRITVRSNIRPKRTNAPSIPIMKKGHKKLRKKEDEEEFPPPPDL